MVAIIDYGVGNLLAIQNILRKIGSPSVITADEEAIRKADKLILPGVGSFAYGMERITKLGLVPFLNDQVLKEKKHVLGLCLGAQLMTTFSDEGSVNGLGWVDARTIKFDDTKVPIIPHMSWSDVKFKKVALATGLEEARFYFVHSYHFKFKEPDQVIGTACYGYEFACAFQHENIFGVQFHPEKSHRYGMKLLENYLAL